MGKLIKYSSPILIAVTIALVFWAMFTTPEDANIENAVAVGNNLYWGYGIFAVAVVVALFAAMWDMLNAPTGIKRTIFSLVAIVALIVGAYSLANGHSYQIVDLNTQGFFERSETVITDACIMVAYVAGVASILVAIYSAVSDALK